MSKGNSLKERETLPSNMLESDKDALESFGVEFLGVVEDDPLSQHVQLPEGWKKQELEIPEEKRTQETDNYAWFSLLDEKGRVRADISYKHTGEDLSAEINVVCRYWISVDYERLKEGEAVAEVLDSDSGEVIHTVKVDVVNDDPYEADFKARRLTGEWLDENFPLWKEPTAYWD